ncbi:D-2-hydroxyglutarate dehydrogenase YdiJ [Vibrio chemaguriensis]|uniref:D-2-hydroxyglutarate dehydrogenase YdiJ n=1 Tax=Vibrio chemaguriensis TaxID=2527672 RepID=UPI001CDC7570|nr:FAD-binding and (Fe-S)-binding domain-containing protein [Vibrio chemaguriensis]MCA2413130.1 FAD-binding oxidoreductase [Vibrio chemaguriensis]MCA2424876.1 FAD-binding oxidoreductase [Vibrio chemaguriensis]
MLPALPLQVSSDPVVIKFFNTLKQLGFKGDTDARYTTRLSMATDNSVYQQLPLSVVFPANHHDVVILGKVSARDEFKHLTFSPRGGGTGTNGQSLNSGIVVDLSRYMNRVLEINEQEGWVRVETGIVKDQLNDIVRPYGYFFSPDLSTSNRATLGGMINTDASGQGSLQYGKTSDHVLALKAVLADGSVLDTEAIQQNKWLNSDVVSRALKITEEVCRDKRQQILDKFPPLNRFLTGYDLKNAINDKSEEFDVTRILCGSEGTLAFITEAKLNLTRIPTTRRLVNVKYDSFDSALRNAPLMVEAEALSVETVDAKVLNLAREDIVWHSVKHAISDVRVKEMQGINFVEFADSHSDDIEDKVERLLSILDKEIVHRRSGIIGYQVCREPQDIEAIYGMRKKAVGLLGATKGQAKPIAFAEDTCVPPENLADFIAEFRTLLDSNNLHYGMFGHVDAGVLHVRPALDMCDPGQEALMHQLSDDVVALVAKYNGLMWGEHGKGYRSEYGPAFFGDELFTELRRIKAAFDPDNKMNPGKICTPLNSDAEMVKVTATKRGYYDRQIPVAVRESLKPVLSCNGNGLCFNYDADSPMCPSFKVTADRRHSPKGRAGIMREWLRRLNDSGFDLLANEQQLLNQTLSVKLLTQKLSKLISRPASDDLSHEVYEVMNGCLACKACASQCPVKVDVPDFRARFLHLYHSRYRRPLRDYLVSNIEQLLPIMAKAPKLVNQIASSRPVTQVLETSIGFVDSPVLSIPTLQSRCQALGVSPFDFAYLESLSPEVKQNYVLIVQDPFTSFYEAELVSDFIQLLQRLGKHPVVLPFKPNGKAQHVKGFLKAFARNAQNTSDFLNQVAELEIPMIGIDAALVLCYRDEYHQVLKEKRGEFTVYTAHEWLVDTLNEWPAVRASDEEPWYLMAHCTEKTKIPETEKSWQSIFHHFGLKLHVIPAGCCGMAGTFGHEVDKKSTSEDIYQLSWKPNIKNLPTERVLATGYSCRSQVKRFEGEVVRHPVQVLASLFNA